MLPVRVYVSYLKEVIFYLLEYIIIFSTASFNLFEIRLNEKFLKIQKMTTSLSFISGFGPS